MAKIKKKGIIRLSILKIDRASIMIKSRKLHLKVSEVADIKQVLSVIIYPMKLLGVVNYRRETRITCLVEIIVGVILVRRKLKKMIL